MADPVAQRMGLLEDFHDAVTIPIIAKPEERAPLPPERPKRRTDPDAAASRRYALAALRGEADAVAHARTGERHRAVFTAGLKMARFVRAGELTTAEVVADIAAAARQAGLRDPEQELIRTIGNGLLAGGRTAA
jgi:hypothetical protein